MPRTILTNTCSGLGAMPQRCQVSVPFPKIPQAKAWVIAHIFLCKRDYCCFFPKAPKVKVMEVTLISLKY